MTPPAETRPGDAAEGWDPQAEEVAAEAQRPTGSRRWWALGTAFVVLAGALVVWFGVAGSQGTVTGDVVTYRADERELTAIIEVSREPGTPARCDVAAVDGDHAEVGSRSIDIPAAPERATRVDVVIRTTTPANNIRVRECQAV